MQVKLVKTMLGGYQVSYGCPQCGEPLRSPVADIGKSDNCPACKQSYVVPTGPDVQKVLNKLQREKKEKEDAENERLADKKREEEAAQLKKRIAERQKAPNEMPAYVTAGPALHRTSQPAEAAPSDLLSWAVKAARSWLQVVLILWWAGCLGGLGLTAIGMSRMVPIFASNGAQATIMDYVMVVLAAVVAVSAWLLITALGTVFVGLAGVLFEIERNTRR